MTSQSALECLCRSPIDCDHSSADWRYPSTADHCLAYCQGGIAATVSSAELPEHCLNIPRQCCAVARYVSTAYGDISCAWVRGALTFAWVILSVFRPTPALFYQSRQEQAASLSVFRPFLFLNVWSKNVSIFPRGSLSRPLFCSLPY